MHTYLWMVRDASGAERAENVVAATANAARAKLEAEGFTNCRLIKDEVIEEMQARHSVIKNKSPDEQAKSFGRAGRTTFWTYLGKVLVDLGSIGLFSALMIAWRWNRHDWIGVGIGAFVLIAFAIFCAVVRLNSYLFARMIRAREWHRGEEVLKYLRWMEIVGQIAKSGIRMEELVRYRAIALVWLGRADEGIALWNDRKPNLSESAYTSYLASLYDEKGETKKMYELAEQAFAASPQVATYAIDLAWRYLLHGHNIERAREMMTYADTLEHTEIAKPFAVRNRGLIAMYGGRFAEAEQILDEALRMWQAAKSQHFRHANISLTKGFLAQVRARLGKAEQARKDLAEALPWLRAANVKPILQACETLVPAGA